MTDELRATLRSLDDNQVRYCVWKSSGQTDAAAAGSTDLDLLIDRHDRRAFEAELLRLGWFSGAAAGPRQLTHKEDFFLITNDMRLLHLDVAYEIFVGEVHNKRILLPVAQTLLSDRVRGTDGVWTSAPSHELALLWIRAAAKLRGRDRVAASAEISHVQDEWDALISATSPDEVAETIQSWGYTLSAGATPSVEIRPEALRRARRELLPQLHRRTASAGASVLRRWRNEANYIGRGVSRRYVPTTRLWARGPTGGGLVVAFVGTDGSGKSTIVEELTTLLGPKFDVLQLYLGSGDGTSSLLRAPIILARRLLPSSSSAPENAAPARPATSTHTATTRPTPKTLTPAQSAAMVVWAIALAIEKRRKVRRALASAAKGRLVLADRWPQATVPGLMDGPLLTDGDHRIVTCPEPIRKWEAGVYRELAKTGPDVVFVLRTSPEVAVRRKPDHDLVEVEIRRALLDSLEFPGARYGAVPIDADQTIEAVRQDVVRSLLTYF